MRRLDRRLTLLSRSLDCSADNLKTLMSCFANTFFQKNIIDCDRRRSYNDLRLCKNINHENDKVLKFFMNIFTILKAMLYFIIGSTLK